MRHFYAFVVFIFLAVPAAACVPPPGLTQQQWYAMCRKDMEYGFSRGFGGAQSHDAFMGSMYQMYRSSHPTFNPTIQQQQQQLANTMANRHQQNMNSMNQQRDDRNNNFNDQQREKAWRQNEEMMSIQNEHCAVWNTAHTYCLKVPN